MKASNKHVLFSRVIVDKQTRQWPTAVFPNAADAKSYGSLLNMAHKTGNTDLAVKLDRHTVLDKDGKLVPGIKFSLVEVPYSPSLADSGDDIFGDGSSSTE